MWERILSFVPVITRMDQEKKRSTEATGCWGVFSVQAAGSGDGHWRVPSVAPYSL